MNYRTLLDPGTISEQDVADINALIPQMASNPKTLTIGMVKEIAGHSYWLVVRDDDDRIKGMGTVTTSRIPTGKVAHFDDIVVDASLRGQGIGERLVLRLIEIAGAVGADRINFTCQAHRVSANALYGKLGFEQRSTNHWVMSLKK